jgi:hypothetical protein
MPRVALELLRKFRFQEDPGLISARLQFQVARLLVFQVWHLPNLAPIASESLSLPRQARYLVQFVVLLQA